MLFKQLKNFLLLKKKWLNILKENLIKDIIYIGIALLEKILDHAYQMKKETSFIFLLDKLEYFYLKLVEKKCFLKIYFTNSLNNIKKI